MGSAVIYKQTSCLEQHIFLNQPEGGRLVVIAANSNPVPISWLSLATPIGIMDVFSEWPFLAIVMHVMFHSVALCVVPGPQPSSQSLAPHSLSEPSRVRGKMPEEEEKDKSSGPQQSRKLDPGLWYHGDSCYRNVPAALCVPTRICRGLSLTGANTERAL